MVPKFNSVLKRGMFENYFDSFSVISKSTCSGNALNYVILRPTNFWQRFLTKTRYKEQIAISLVYIMCKRDCKTSIKLFPNLRLWNCGPAEKIKTSPYLAISAI